MDSDEREDVGLAGLGTGGGLHIELAELLGAGVCFGGPLDQHELELELELCIIFFRFPFFILSLGTDLALDTFLVHTLGGVLAEDDSLLLSFT